MTRPEIYECVRVVAAFAFPTSDFLTPPDTSLLFPSLLAEVYPLKARITGNCGGAGICGTCAVKVLDGMANLNAPSKNEQNTLRDKPADYRLSCCARVSGPITIKTKP